MRKYYSFAFSLFFTLIGCQIDTSSNSTPIPGDGDLTSTFTDKNNSPATLTPEQKMERERMKLLKEGWKEDNLNNGLMPSCYNFAPRYDRSINNYLKINVGSGTEVVAKLMNVNTQNCIRYVYIEKSSSYTIANIPEGVYYLKLAYGKEWLSKVEGAQCIGRFLRNPMYKKGEDLMDFNIIQRPDGYSIPSYEISLDVISTSVHNSFSTSGISESEFNK